MQKSGRPTCAGTSTKHDGHRVGYRDDFGFWRVESRPILTGVILLGKIKRQEMVWPEQAVTAHIAGTMARHKAFYVLRVKRAEKGIRPLPVP